MKQLERTTIGLASFLAIWLCCAALSGCKPPDENYRTLGFGTEAEMQNAFKLGYHTKERFEAATRYEHVPGVPSKYPRCAGSYELKKCEEDEARLAAESVEAKKRRALEMRTDQVAAADAVAAMPLLTESEQQPPAISTTPENNSRVRTITIAALRRMAATGMAPYQTFSVETRINGNDAIENRLCDLVRSDGYCEIGRDSIRVEMDLGQRSKREALYDLRGLAGTRSVCAAVEMRPDGLIYLTDVGVAPCAR